MGSKPVPGTAYSMLVQSEPAAMVAPRQMPGCCMSLIQPKAVRVKYLHKVNNGEAHAPPSLPPSAGKMLRNMDTTYCRT